MEHLATRLSSFILSSPEKVIVNIHVINKPDGEGELKSQSQDCFDEKFRSIYQ